MGRSLVSDCVKTAGLPRVTHRFVRCPRTTFASAARTLRSNLTSLGRSNRMDHRFSSLLFISWSISRGWGTQFWPWDPTDNGETSPADGAGGTVPRGVPTATCACHWRKGSWFVLARLEMSWRSCLAYGNLTYGKSPCLKDLKGNSCIKEPLPAAMLNDQRVAALYLQF